MNSLSVFLGTLAVLSFFMGSAGFLFMVWKISWAVSGFVNMQDKRAAFERQMLSTLSDFVKKQSETNQELWDAMQVQADRLNRLVEGKTVEVN
jgi:hypothetical protein